jgi:hypothetical protein
MAADSPLLIPKVVLESETVQDILKEQFQPKAKKPINWAQSVLSLGKKFLVPSQFELFEKKLNDEDLYEQKPYIDLVDEFSKAINTGTYKSAYNFVELLPLGIDLALNTDFTTKLEDAIYKWPEEAEPETLFGDVTALMTEYAVPAKIATGVLKGLKNIPKVKRAIDKVEAFEEKVLPLPKFQIKTPLTKTPVTVMGGSGVISRVARRVGYGGALLGLTDMIGSGPEAPVPFWSELEDTENLTGREKAVAKLKNKLRYGQEGATIGAGFGLLGKPMALGFKYGLYSALDVGGAGARTLNKVVTPVTNLIGKDAVVLPRVAKAIQSTGSLVGKDFATRLAVSLTNPKLLTRKIPPFAEWRKYGLLDTDPLKVKLKKLDNFLSYFRSVGRLTRNVASVSQDAIKGIRAQQKTVNTLTDDLDKTAYKLAESFRRTYDDPRTTKAIYEQYLDFLEEYILGQKKLSDLPEGLRGSVEELKNKLDILYNAFKNTFDKEDLLRDSADTFKNVYRRNFAVFTSENWAPREGQVKFDNMKDYYKEVIKKNKDFTEQAKAAFPEAKTTEESIEQYAIQKTYDLLHTAKNGGKDPLKTLNMFAGKDWLRISDEKSFIKTGEELPGVMQNFLGRYDDVRASILTTAADLVSSTTMRKVYDETIRRALKDGILFKNANDAINIGRIPVDKIGKIAVDSLGVDAIAKEYQGFAGDKAIVEAIMGRSRKDPGAFGKLYQNLLLWKSAAQYGKTVLSPATQVRNVTSASFFALANMHLGGGNLLQNLNLVLNDIFGAGKNLDMKALTRRIEKATELGVLDENIITGEVTAIVRDIKKGKFVSEESLFNALTETKFLRQAGEKIEKLYAGGDNIWKLYGWEYEMSRLKSFINNFDDVKRWYKDIAKQDYFENSLKTGKPKTLNEAIEEMAAWYVTNTYPTYSKVPEVIQSIRRTPFFGSFVAFPAEMIRTSSNIMSLSLREIASNDPNLRAIGLRRLLGLATVMGGAELGASKLSEVLAGMTDKEVAVYREFFAAPWEINANLAFMKPLKNGMSKVLNLTYFNGYSVITDAARSLINRIIKPTLSEYGLAEDLRKNPDDAILYEFFKPEGPIYTLLQPFLTEPIGLESVFDITFRGGQTREGVRIWGKNDKLIEKAVKAFEHFIKSVQPGVTRTAGGIINAATGNVRADNRPYDLADELLSLFAGVRLSNVDVLSSFKYSIRGFKDIRSESYVSENFYSFVDWQSKSPEIKANEFRKIQEEAFRAQKKFYNTIQAALYLGVKEEDIRDALKGFDVGKKQINAIMEGRFIPVTYSKDLFESNFEEFKKKNPDIENRVVRDWFIPENELDDVYYEYLDKEFEEFDPEKYMEKIEREIELMKRELYSEAQPTSPVEEIQTPPLPETPTPDVASATNLANINVVNPMTGLTRTEGALLSPGEQAIAQKSNRRIV